MSMNYLMTIKANGNKIIWVRMQGITNKGATVDFWKKEKRATLKVLGCNTHREF